MRYLSVPILLGCNTLPDEANQTAANHVVFIENVLIVYGKGHQNNEFVVGDNTNSNPAIAYALGKRCYSHTLDLEVKKVLVAHEVLR